MARGSENLEAIRQEIWDSRYAPVFDSSSVRAVNQHIIEMCKGGRQYYVFNEGSECLTEGALTLMPNVPLADTMDLLDILGYSKIEIESLINASRSCYTKVVFAGAGGVNTNILYWMKKLMEKFNHKPLSNASFLVVDGDSYSLDNSVRIGFSFNNPWGTVRNRKVNWWEHWNLLYDLYGMSYYDTMLNSENIDEIIPEGSVVVGAVDFDTRKLLSNNPRFIYLQAATSGMSSYMFQNPTLETRNNDTYGMIYINSFYLQTLKITIEFLKYIVSLRDPEVHTIDYSNVEIPEGSKDESTLKKLKQKYTRQSDRSVEFKEILDFDFQKVAADTGLLGALGMPPVGQQYIQKTGFRSIG